MELLAWISGFAAGIAVLGVVAAVQARRRRQQDLRAIERSEQLFEMVEMHRGDDLWLQQEILTWAEVQERLKEGTAMGIQMDYREIKRRIGA